MLGKTHKMIVKEPAAGYWPFRLVDGAKGVPMIELDFGGEKKQRKKPEEISAEVLKKIKEIAEENLQTKVGHAVITVPAKFDQVSYMGKIFTPEIYLKKYDQKLLAICQKNKKL
jgi:molecular chaperone DnaK (HSP70)